MGGVREVSYGSGSGLARRPPLSPLSLPPSLSPSLFPPSLFSSPFSPFSPRMLFKSAVSCRRCPLKGRYGLRRGVFVGLGVWVLLLVVEVACCGVGCLVLFVVFVCLGV